MDDDFDRIRDNIGKSINGYLNFIMSNSDDAEKITNLSKDYNIGSNINFNIFTSISDIYKRENLHSDILRLIFDPRTEKICDDSAENLGILIDFIGKELNKKIELDLDTVSIDRETYKIDILIYDSKKNCVFIENKINGAVDREDQIGGYYEKLSQKEYSVKAIVYLTLSPLKKLDWDYSIKNKAKQKEIREILLELPVVNKKGKSNFIDGVLEGCINQAKKDVSTVYLSEYRDLLKKLGGDFMSDELRIQLMKKIYADKDALKSFKVIGDLWEKKADFIGYAFLDYFQHELGFEVHGDGVTVYAYKTIKKDINIGFHEDLSFGFVYSPDGEEEIEIGSANRRRFIKLLGEKSLKKYFVEEEIIEDDPWWVYIHIDPDKITCLNDLETMEKELERLLKEKTSA